MNTNDKESLKVSLLSNEDHKESKLQSSTDLKTKPAPKEQPYPPVPFLKLYRFATGSEKCLLVFALFLAIFLGGAFPAFSILWGNTANAFAPTANGDILSKTVGKNSIYIVGIGILTMLLFFLILTIIKYIGQKQGTRLRTEYLKAIVRQEMGFFDLIDPAELSSRVESDCKTIIEGTEDKIVMFVYGIFTFMGGFIVAFIRGWQLALILLALTPFQAVAGFLYGRFVSKAVERTADAYGRAGAIAEQALSSIRTIVGLAGEDKECERYSRELEHTKSTMIKFGLIQGISIGFFSMFTYVFYAFSFYFGSIFIKNDIYDNGTGSNYTGGDVLAVYFAIISGASSLAMTTPSLRAIAAAKQTAAKVFATIDRKSKIDTEDPAGDTPEIVEARIQFKDVVFSYPSNSDRVVLDKINLEIAPGKKTAIVGESGSGKSTIVQLIERLYDPASGLIELNDINLKDINLQYLRKNISYVGQEPVLFTGTIRDNLELARDNVTEEDIVDALKKANAYDFVMKLEKKIDTFVGTGGIQLSGGQKQRIAIARAILRNAKILLLDEATSALDRKNERTIQETLDKISEGLTTVIIAHRLSTVKNADNIVVLNNGVIEETGTHENLINKQGLYYKLQLGQLNLEEIQKTQGNNPKVKAPNAEGDNEEEEEDSAEEEDEIKKEGDEAQASEPLKNPSLVKRKSKSGINSNAAEPIKEDPEASKKKPSGRQALFRLFTFSKPEIPLFIASLVVSALIGAAAPAVAILISDILFVILDPSKEDFQEKADLYSLMFLVVAFLMFFLYLFQFWFFAVLAESLTNRLRVLVFNKFLRMNIAWHDRTENSSGILSTTLSTDAANVSALTSTVIGLTFQAISSLVTGIIIAFVASWQVALVSVLMVPVIMFISILQRKTTSKLRAQDEEIKHSGQIVTEVINNIKTVVCLGQEKTFRVKYETLLRTIETRMIKLGSIQGIFLGANQLCVFGYFGVTFYVGALASKDLGQDGKSIFISLFAIINAVFNVSGALRYLPDLNKTNDSAALLFKFIDMESEIDIDNKDLKYKEPIRGYIEFRNVAFKYPSRDNMVFKGLNLKVNAGKKIALVGASGCGKSTIIQLLLRFYDVIEGEILIDGINIKEFDLRHLRRNFGFVSQEPTLFNGTIEYNIK